MPDQECRAFPRARATTRTDRTDRRREERRNSDETIEVFDKNLAPSSRQRRVYVILIRFANLFSFRCVTRYRRTEKLRLECDFKFCARLHENIWNWNIQFPDESRQPTYIHVQWCLKMTPDFLNCGSRLNLLRRRSMTISRSDPFKIRVFTFRIAIKGGYHRIDRTESDNEITFTCPLRNSQPTSRNANFPGRLSMNQFTIGASQRPTNDIFYALWKKDKKEASEEADQRRKAKSGKRGGPIEFIPIRSQFAGPGRAISPCIKFIVDTVPIDD